MSMSRQVAAATQVGLLARSQGGSDAALEALALIRHVVPADASSIVGLDPAGRPVQIAALDYPSALASALLDNFVESPWMTMVRNSALPQSISAQPGQSFRKGRFFEEHILPQGFTDGMTAELRRDGRRVGLIHMSATEDRFDHDAQELLSALAPALSILVDTQSQSSLESRLVRHSSAAVLHQGSAVELPGHSLPSVLNDSLFLETIAKLVDDNQPQVRGLWPLGNTWHQFTLEQVVSTAGGPEETLLQTFDVPAPYRLSRREVEVLSCMAAGMSNAAIARHLVISERTVHTHVGHVLRKTGSASRAEASALAHREAIMQPIIGRAR
jgi:DNA-binding NarL/FixJ family response regulator